MFGSEYVGREGEAANGDEMNLCELSALTVKHFNGMLDCVESPWCVFLAFRGYIA